MQTHKQACWSKSHKHMLYTASFHCFFFRRILLLLSVIAALIQMYHVSLAVASLVCAIYFPLKHVFRHSFSHTLTYVHQWILI